MSDFDDRLGWMPLGCALELIQPVAGGEAWPQPEQPDGSIFLDAAIEQIMQRSAEPMGPATKRLLDALKAGEIRSHKRGHVEASQLTAASWQGADVGLEAFRRDRRGGLLHSGTRYHLHRITLAKDDFAHWLSRLPVRTRIFSEEDEDADTLALTAVPVTQYITGYWTIKQSLAWIAFGEPDRGPPAIGTPEAELWDQAEQILRKDLQTGRITGTGRPQLKYDVEQSEASSYEEISKLKLLGELIFNEEVPQDQSWLFVRNLSDTYSVGERNHDIWRDVLLPIDRLRELHGQALAQGPAIVLPPASPTCQRPTTVGAKPAAAEPAITSAAYTGNRRGPPPVKSEGVTQQMITDYAFAPQLLGCEKQDALSSKYKVSRDTVEKARRAALKKLQQNSGKTPTIDK